MLMRISEELLGQVRDGTRLEQVAGRYTELRRAGSRFKGRCPLHDEKTPSFFVAPDQNRWHCFGCGRGGDVFALVMEIEQLRFREAVELVADWAGISLPDTADDPAAAARAEHSRRAGAVLDQAVEWFGRWLRLDQPQATAARRWLAERKFTAAIAADWEVGFAPPTRTAVSTRLVVCLRNNAVV